MNLAIMIVLTAIALIVIGGGLMLWASRRGLFQWWRKFQIRRKFRPAPQATKYRLIRVDQPME